MRTLLLILGMATAVTVSFVSSSPVEQKRTIKKGLMKQLNNVSVSPEFKWTQLAPAGSGTHQQAWKPGTYPSALIPVQAFNGKLWMIGQKRSWSSSDGIKWDAHDKADWGERISMHYVFFNKKLWMTGGMAYADNTFLNEIWSSLDGINWQKEKEHAEWPPRKGHEIVEFNNALWLFGGATAVDEHRSPNKYINDIWKSTDGLRWERVLTSAPWSGRDYPHVLVFKGKLWLVGGQGYSDIWNSQDGKNWTLVRKNSPWKDRYDYGVAVFDNLLFVYGGREAEPRNAYNDVWYSVHGDEWRLQTEHAPWSPRSAASSIVVGNQLFLYGGKHTGHKNSWSGDLWSMTRQ